MRLDPSYTPNGQIFFCDHLTPELVYRPEWQDHKNGVLNIIRVVLEAKDPAKSIELLRNTFPDSQIVEIDGGLRLKAEDKIINYLTPKATKKEFGDTLSKAKNDKNRKIALSFKTKSLAQTKQVLINGNIKFIERESSLLVPASETFGVVMTFVE